jgi:hypothetical protein
LIVLPVGEVKIDLGPEGELVGFYSNYAADVTVVNQARLDSDEARKRALDAVKLTGANPVLGSVDGGAQIVWVTGREGRIAYQFGANGRQVVIDAETGEVLQNRNRRTY